MVNYGGDDDTDAHGGDDDSSGADDDDNGRGGDDDVCLCIFVANYLGMSEVCPAMNEPCCVMGPRLR